MTAVPASSATIDVVSPSSEEIIARVPADAPEGIDDAVRAAPVAFDHGEWPLGADVIGPVERKASGLAADVAAARELAPSVAFAPVAAVPDSAVPS